MLLDRLMEAVLLIKLPAAIQEDLLPQAVDYMFVRVEYPQSFSNRCAGHLPSIRADVARQSSVLSQEHYLGS